MNGEMSSQMSRSMIGTVDKAVNKKEKALKEVFTKTVEENKIAMFRLAYSMVLTKEDAEDVVSETVLKAFSHLSELRNIRKMKSWLFQILVNESKNCLMRRSKIDLVEDSSFIAEKSVHEEETSDLLELVYQLEDSFKEVVLLYYFDEFSIKETAKILNISEGTVKSRLSRARKKLKEFLEKSDAWKG